VAQKRNKKQVNLNILNTKLSTLYSTSLSTQQLSWLLFTNPFLLKIDLFNSGNIGTSKTLINRLSSIQALNLDHPNYSNLYPHESFRKQLSKRVLNSFANRKFREDIIPTYQNAIIRFIEFCTGKKALFQFYPFVHQHISKEYIVRYKR